MPDHKIDQLKVEIAACRLCSAYLPAGPRPVVQISATAKLLIIGQAPGNRVHQTGIPWNDPSGNRLREWTGLSVSEFYDATKVALMPMGFCYPGTGPSGDFPPRAECAPMWHGKIRQLMPDIGLTLLVGSYAQARYIPTKPKQSLTENVRNFQNFGETIFPLPHPSWRSSGWMKRNPWFEADVLPELRRVVQRFK